MRLALVGARNDMEERHFERLQYQGLKFENGAGRGA
jgi:hypothetical protein